MSKGVRLLLIAVGVIFISSVFFALRSLKASENTTVEIVQDNKVLYTIDISKENDRTIHITYADGGWNDIRIEDGKICVCDADCPDKTCVKTGVLRSENIPIVCLPHKLVIRFKEQN